MYYRIGKNWKYEKKLSFNLQLVLKLTAKLTFKIDFANKSLFQFTVSFHSLMQFGQEWSCLN